MNAHTQAFETSIVLLCSLLGSLITLMAAGFQMSLLNPRPELVEGDLCHTWMDLPPVVSHLILLSALAFAWIHAPISLIFTSSYATLFLLPSLSTPHACCPSSHSALW